MDYILRKDSFGNWHFDDIKTGSVRERVVCRRLARMYLNDTLIANTPNFLVECVLRHRISTWPNLPSYISHCNELFFYEFDGCVYFFFEKPHN